MIPSLQISAVHLRVADLARSVEFYTRQLGFVPRNVTAGHADLAVAPGAPVLLTLTGDSSAPPAAPDAAGLFHAALLFPSRPALGAWLKHAATAGVAFTGVSDHGVSEALYFSDPDGHGLEFYTDRAPAAWPYAANGELAMTTQHLDVPALLAAAAPPSATPLAGLPAAGAAPADARWGHLHLRVTDLARSEAFYRTALGVNVTQGSYPGARFLGADGYHHHLGLNTWGQPRAPRSATALGLVEATFSRRGVRRGQRLSDPDGIAVRVQPAA
jgi:catechol 2,3-dioxygenase